MKSLNKKALKIFTVASLVYLVLPVMIFLLGYFRLAVGIPAALFVCFAFYKTLFDVHYPNFELSSKNFRFVFLLCIFIIALWVLFSGIGAFSFQNTDFDCRNAIFRYMVQSKWPVVQTELSQEGRGLVYYIGFWFPCALIGKIFGFDFGLKFMALWAAIGAFLVFVNICIYTKRFSLMPLFFLVFFSGLDCIGERLFPHGEYYLSQHLEWWLTHVQFSSNTTQLYWVFNQSLPAWLAVALIMNQRNFKSVLFIMSLILISSPLPFVGLAPIVVAKYFYSVKKGEPWKNIFSLQNIIGAIIVGGLTAIYLFGNTTLQSTGSANVFFKPPLKRLCVFLFLEFGIYVAFIFWSNKKNYLLYVISAILLVCPFLRIGGGDDFCMRASIPALFILMLFCIEFFYVKMKRAVFFAYCVVLLIGAVTPFHEIFRSLNQTRLAIINKTPLYVPEADVLQAANFSAPLEGNVFFEYLAKGGVSVKN